MLPEMLVVPQHGAHSYERRALLRSDLVVLARAHGQLLQAEAFSQLAEPAEVRPGRLRLVCEWRHRRETADLDRRCGDEGFDVPGGDARLRLLAGEIDLDERRDAQTVRGRLGVEG